MYQFGAIIVMATAWIARILYIKLLCSERNKIQFDLESSVGLEADILARPEEERKIRTNSYSSSSSISELYQPELELLVMSYRISTLHFPPPKVSETFCISAWHVCNNKRKINEDLTKWIEKKI